MDKISEPHYRAGRDSFAAGDTLRTVFKRMALLVDKTDGDMIVMSFMLGFVDSLLARLRERA